MGWAVGGDVESVCGYELIKSGLVVSVVGVSMMEVSNIMLDPIQEASSRFQRMKLMM